MLLSHRPSLELTSAILYRLNNSNYIQIANLSISESFNNILYKYGICGDSTGIIASNIFTNVTVSSLQSSQSENNVQSHLLNQNSYNLSRAISDINDFSLSTGSLTFDLADFDNLNVKSLNIIGKLENFSYF